MAGPRTPAARALLGQSSAGPGRRCPNFSARPRLWPISSTRPFAPGQQPRVPSPSPPPRAECCLPAMWGHNPQFGNRCPSPNRGADLTGYRGQLVPLRARLGATSRGLGPRKVQRAPACLHVSGSLTSACHQRLGTAGRAQLLSPQILFIVMVTAGQKRVTPCCLR